MTLHNDIRGIDTSNVQAIAHGSNLKLFVSILIESGLITFVGQLTQSIMYKSANTAFPLVGGSVVMLYVRAASCLFCVLINFIYLLHRELRPLLSLCVSRRAFHMIIIHQRQWNQRIRGPQHSRWNLIRSWPLRSNHRIYLNHDAHSGSSYAIIGILIFLFCACVVLTKINSTKFENLLLPVTRISTLFNIIPFILFWFQGVQILIAKDKIRRLTFTSCKRRDVEFQATGVSESSLMLQVGS